VFSLSFFSGGEEGFFRLLDGLKTTAKRPNHSAARFTALSKRQKLWKDFSKHLKNPECCRGQIQVWAFGW
jgi:hypothetical protein